MRRTVPGTRGVFATNIFDKRNPTGVYLTDPTSALFTNVFVEDPRVVGVSVGAIGKHQGRTKKNQGATRRPFSLRPAGQRCRGEMYSSNGEIG